MDDDEFDTHIDEDQIQFIQAFAGKIEKKLSKKLEFFYILFSRFQNQPRYIEFMRNIVNKM